MSLQDVHSLYRIRLGTIRLNRANILHGIDYEVSKEVGLSIKKFGGHRSFGGIYKCFLTKSINLNTQITAQELDGLSQSQSESTHDGGGMDVVLDQLITSLQKLRGKDDNRGGTITNFSILNL